MHRLSIVLFGTGLVAGCVNTPAKRDFSADRQAGFNAPVVAELRGLNPSVPQNCIDSYHLRDVQGEPHGSTLLYRINARLVYRNDTSGGCDGLAQGDTLVDQNYPGNRYGNTKLCRGDLLYSRSVRDANPSGSCTRGVWIAYTK